MSTQTGGSLTFGRDSIRYIQYCIYCMYECVTQVTEEHYSMKLMTSEQTKSIWNIQTYDENQPKFIHNNPLATVSRMDKLRTQSLCGVATAKEVLMACNLNISNSYQFSVGVFNLIHLNLCFQQKICFIRNWKANRKLFSEAMYQCFLLCYFLN